LDHSFVSGVEYTNGTAAILPRPPALLGDSTALAVEAGFFQAGLDGRRGSDVWWGLSEGGLASVDTLSPIDLGMGYEFF
jgi:hypothetical protein